MLPALPDYTSSLEALDIKVEYLEDEYKEIAALDISDVHTSDILAWYILARKGGVVSDTDIIFTRPFDYERFKDTEFGIVCFDGLPKANYMPVSFMISQPNVIHEKIYQASLKLVDKNVYESAGTIVIENTLGSFVDICRKNKEVNVTKLPNKIIFPFADDYEWGFYAQLAFIYNTYDHLDKDCIGIHWYAGAPGHQKFNEAYANGDYGKYNNTIGAAIRRAIEIRG